MTTDDGFMSGPRSPRSVVLLVFPGAQLLDIAGPLEVFKGAGQLVRDAYAVKVVAREPGPSTTSSGLAVTPDTVLHRSRGGIDTLVVSGGPGVAQAERDQGLVDWLTTAAARSRRVTSVCNGAFLLARAGILDGRRATTHWASTGELARRYPKVAVEHDPIFVRDGHVWTSAGVTAGMDLALALVEEDLGREIALEIARWLVLFVQRPGGQAQFSSHLIAQHAERRALREIQTWILDNLAADLRVEALAERACMSPRNFARAFRREVGVTPGAYVELARVEAARQALTDGADGIETITAGCGFGTAETMRRAFHRRLGVGPAEYRARFRQTLDRAV